MTDKYMLRKTRLIGRRQTLYSVLRPTFHNLGNDHFIPEYDSSHNMTFACEKCAARADILEVRLDNESGGSLYLWLGCPSCGATGLRKLYLSVSHPHPTMLPFRLRKTRYAGVDLPSVGIPSTIHLLRKLFIASTMYYLPDVGGLAKVKKSIAVDEQLAKEIDGYHRQLVKKAADSGARIPNQSNVYEDLVRRGWEAVKRQAKK